MFYALVYYPHIEHEGFHEFRNKYEPCAFLLPEHVTFIFPTPKEIGRERLELHIKTILKRWKPFQVHFCTIKLNWDHWMYLGANEGHDEIVVLHDQLYEGILSPYLREDLPFYPHIALGLFSKEGYNLNNPTAKLTLDTPKYNQARKEFESLNFELRCTIDQLTLLQLDAEFTTCEVIKNFPLSALD